MRRGVRRPAQELPQVLEHIHFCRLGDDTRGTRPQERLVGAWVRLTGENDHRRPGKTHGGGGSLVELHDAPQCREAIEIATALWRGGGKSGRSGG